MPSFFERLGRFWKGEPVFEASDEPIEGKQPRPGEIQPALVHRAEHAGTPLDARGNKILPVIIVNEINCHENGTKMDCYGVLQNMSDERLEIDKITVLGVKREIDNFLRAREEREFLLYSGLRPRDTGHTRAELEYKNEAGDYFAAELYVEFTIESDGMCLIKGMRLVGPVRDI